MRLQRRYFLGNLILFGIYALIIIIIPTYVIMNDVGKIGDQVWGLLLQKHRRLTRDQEVLVQDIYERQSDAFKGFLLLDQTIANNSDEKEILSHMLRLSSISPDVGLVQYQNTKNNQAIVITSAEAPLYLARFLPLEDGNIVGVMNEEVDGENSALFYGTPLKESSKSGQSLFLIYPFNEAEARSPEAKDQLGLLKEELLSILQFDLRRINPSQYESFNSREIWAKKNFLIENLVTAIKKTEDAIGIASFNEEARGNAILLKDAVKEKVVFDASVFFDSPQEEMNSKSIADQPRFILEPDLQHIYLVETLKEGSSYFTLGSAIDVFVREIAQWTDKDMLIQLNGKLVRAFDDKGGIVPQETIYELEKLDIFKHSSGFFQFEDKTYLYNNLLPQSSALSLFQLAEVGGEDTSTRLTEELSTTLSWKISMQLLAISLIFIGLIQFVLGRLVVKTVIKPVEKLAVATELVVAGKYADVVLEEMKGRTDEIALLNRSFAEMVQGLRDKEMIRGVLDKVVSKDVAAEILKSKIQLGGEERIVTTLFGDIRGFTHMTEFLTPKETVDLLNECMTRITHEIEGHGGVIDKFVGDEVMALFGAPTTRDNDPVNAITAALLVIKQLEKWNVERKSQGLRAVEMGFGISTGKVLAGNMGAEDRLNYTVLGAQVNLGARLCGAAKKGEILINENAYNDPNVQNSFEIESLDPIELKGFSKPIPVFRVIDFKKTTPEEK